MYLNPNLTPLSADRIHPPLLGLASVDKAWCAPFLFLHYLFFFLHVILLILPFFFLPPKD